MSDLARFLFQSGHFSILKGRVKPAGFNPGNRADLSVFDIRGTDDRERQDLGAQVAAEEGRSVKACAELPLTALDDLPLEFIRDDVPIPRHGNIIGFPTGEDDEARGARHELATTLANRARLVA